MGTFDCTLTPGYFNAFGSAVGHHTYVLANRDGTDYVMPCFGMYATYEGEHQQTGVVYPAELWTPYIIGSRNAGRSLQGNLFVALGMAQFSTAPAFNWTKSDWDKSYIEYPNTAGLVSHSGIVYGVTGVCHQACNRVLWASRTERWDETPVNWPPSFTASYWVYGFYGSSATVSAAMSLASSLVATAQSIPDMSNIPVLMSAANREVAINQDIKSYREENMRTVQESVAQTYDSNQRAHEIATFMEGQVGSNNVESVKSQLHENAVLEVDKDFNDTKSQLDKELLTGSISNEQYAQNVNEAAQQLFVELQNRFTPEDYSKLFPNLNPEQGVQIITPEHMHESYEEFQKAIVV